MMRLFDRPTEPRVATIAAATHNALGKAARRLLPCLFVLYVINFGDRANISVSPGDERRPAPERRRMRHRRRRLLPRLRLFQVPANAALAPVPVERSRRSSWQVCARGHGLGRNAHLVSGAFALGVAEGGFFPASSRILTMWLPCATRQPPFCWPFRSPTRSALPLSGLIIGRVHMAGYPAGGQYFVIEALPALLLAPLLRRACCRNGPQQASWLTPRNVQSCRPG